MKLKEMKELTPFGKFLIALLLSPIPLIGAAVFIFLADDILEVDSPLFGLILNVLSFGLFLYLMNL